MSDQDAIATSPYAENYTLDQQPTVRYYTEKKLPDPGVNQTTPTIMLAPRMKT